MAFVAKLYDEVSDTFVWVDRDLDPIDTSGLRGTIADAIYGRERGYEAGGLGFNMNVARGEILMDQEFDPLIPKLSAEELAAYRLITDDLAERINAVNIHIARFKLARKEKKGKWRRDITEALDGARRKRKRLLTTYQEIARIIIDGTKARA